MTTHLTFNEIMDFLSFETLDNNSLKLASTVNTHIARCQECFELVRSFQLLREEFEELGMTGEFTVIANKRFKEKKTQPVRTQNQLQK